MVATRRGGRVCSPSQTNSDKSAGVVATPATSTRRTRRTATQYEETSDSQHEVLSEATGKRKTRMSKQTVFSNQTDSTHEADVSESDSCCSALSDTEAVPNTRMGRGAPSMDQPNFQEDEVTKEDSCISPGSVSSEQNTCRATRSLRKSRRSVLSASMVTDSPTRVTRSTQRAAVSSNQCSKSQSEEAELSDSGSCASGALTTTVRRSTRARKGGLVKVIPMQLEEASDGSKPRRENQSKSFSCDSQTCDSDGFESGPCPTPRRSTRKRKEPKQTGTAVTDSESDLTDAYTQIGSPLSMLGRGTRSNSSSQATPATRATAKAQDVLVERALTQSSTVTVTRIAEESILSDDLNLEDTVNAVSDLSVIEVCEEDRTLTLDDEDLVNVEPQASQEAAPGQEVSGGPIAIQDAEMPEASCVHGFTEKTTSDETNTSDVSTQENIPHDDVKADWEGNPTVCDSADAEKAEAICVPAVEAENQQRELSAKAGADVVDPAVVESCEMMMPVYCHVPLNKPVTVTTCEPPMAPVIVVTEEGKEVTAMEVEVNSQTAVPSTEGIDAIQTADGDNAPRTTEPVVVTSRQNPKVCLPADTVLRDPIVIKKPGFISLLESSEDESMESSDEDEGDQRERRGSDVEREAACEEDEAGPSGSPAAAVQSVALNHDLFVIDTQPGPQSGEQYYVDKQGKSPRDGEMVAIDELDEDEFVDEEASGDDDEDFEVLFTRRNPRLKELSSCIDPGLGVKELGGLYINFDGSKSKTVSNSLRKLKEQKSQDELMKKSVIGPEFEKKDAVPPYMESKHNAKLKRKEEREKTTGTGWFNMRAPEMTEELKGDLKALKMRGAMDPKRFYKKNDRDGFPKYFQVATVVDNPVDFYHSRLPKKERKRTIVEELLADAEFRHNNKKKFKQIMTEQAAMNAGKKNKNKKFKKQKQK
ncbi:hypothetical protein DPEC_G00341580 [Dallia pectoralis]|uniref:Uncharacterized protein n=1 Tax=Dallia pectoralis TaxID=75939 RepID=A0ACC2F5H6_DALPE|nr:hypothetical protein DPEC_G00341580 [Dallia pectoralis]